MKSPSSFVAIVDYGMGNLYSVLRACEHVGLPAAITSDPWKVAAAAGVILPGVGAFGDAMAALRQADLVRALCDHVAQDKPFFGICLGMQLLMTESREFGTHKGLNLFEGQVVRFDNPREDHKVLKVPEVGWNTITPSRTCRETARWRGTLLEGQVDGEFMYFVHSFYVVPRDSSLELSTTSYGHIRFCSSLGKSNLFACQFHPERSGPRGLEIYARFAARISRWQPEEAGSNG